MLRRTAVVKLLSGVLAASFLVTGCGGAAPKPAAPEAPKAAPAEEKRLTLYTSFGADLYNPIAEAFEKETGIKVDVVFAGTGEMLKRIDSEKAAPQGDVMLGGGAESFEAYRASFEPYKVKEDAAVPAALKAKDHLWYGFNSLPMVIAYNKNMVKESEAPKSWKDVTDPKWAGKVAMADANKSGTSFVQVVTMLTLFGRDDNKGWDFVKSVVKNGKILGSSSLPIKGVNDGEYPVALTYEHGAYKYAKAGGPVAWVYPSEGTSTIPDSLAVIKGAKHPQNARIFMDWMFTQKTQELASKLGLRPARTDVAPPEGLIASDKLKFIELDVPWVASNRDKILNTWKDVLTAGSR